VLAHSNRVVRGEDFRATMRRGKRVTLDHAVIYSVQRAGSSPARFGFVVPKTVGKAVTRNLMRRRLRSIGHELVAGGFSGADVVVRALPGSERLSWSSLHQEITTGIEKGTRR
jgi:ribonuclease P protein component